MGSHFLGAAAKSFKEKKKKHDFNHHSLPFLHLQHAQAMTAGLDGDEGKLKIFKIQCMKSSKNQ